MCQRSGLNQCCQVCQVIFGCIPAWCQDEDDKVEIISVHVPSRRRPQPWRLPSVTTGGNSASSVSQSQLRMIRLQRRREYLLLRPYPDNPPAMNELMHLGHILHGLTKLLRLLCTSRPWTDCIFIMVDPTLAEKDYEFAAWESSAGNILSILASETHWALLVTNFYAGASVLFDGKSNAVIREKAMQHHEYFTRKGYDLSFVDADVPKQQDDWSCGHRVLLTVNCLLKELTRKDARKEGFPIEIPPEWVCAHEMEKLLAYLTSCQTWQMPQEEPLPLSPVKQEPSFVATKKEQPAEEAKRPGVKKVEKLKALPVKAERSAAPDAPSLGQKPDISSAQELKKPKVQLVKAERPTALNAPSLSEKASTSGSSCAKGLGPEARASAPEHAEARASTPERNQKIQEDIDMAKLQEEQLTNGMRPRGRPRKGTQKEEHILKTWLANNRKGIYQETENSETKFVYFCVPCHKDVQFYRDAITYLRLHERDCCGHHKGLKKMGLNVIGEVVEVTHACTGVLIQESTCDLGKLLGSLRMWMSVGQPSLAPAYGSAKVLLEEGCWRSAGDDFFVRHKDCSGHKCVSHCDLCEQFATRPKISAEIAQWGYRIDLVTLAHHIAYGTVQDRRGQEDLMRSRDYMTSGMAGADFESLMKRSDRNIIWHVRRLLESIAVARRNTAYQDFIQFRVHGLADFQAPENVQKDVLAGLIKKYQAALEEGTCLQDVTPSVSPDTESLCHCFSFIWFIYFGCSFSILLWIQDFRLASMVASGELRRSGGALLDALFKSAMLRVNRKCELRPNSSKYFDNELSCELLFTLGRGKCLREMLRRATF